jgi:hypothetical protein
MKPVVAVASAIGIVACLSAECSAQQPTTPKRSVDSLVDDVLKNVDKTSPSRPPQSQPASPSSPQATGTAPGGAITASEMEALRQKIRPCWYVTAGQTLPVVAIRVQMASDGRPVNAEHTDANRYRTDANYRSAADAALRAVMNPRCQPWPLPPEKYAAWRTLALDFDGR